MINLLCITSTEKHSSVNSYITTRDKGRQGPQNLYIYIKRGKVSVRTSVTAGAASSVANESQ